MVHKDPFVPAEALQDLIISVARDNSGQMTEEAKRSLILDFEVIKFRLMQYLSDRDALESRIEYLNEMKQRRREISV